MSKLVPLTVIKGAGHEFIPLPQGENATVADFHTIRTKTDAPAHITSGFYKIEAGPARPAHYDFEESKYVLSGQIDVLDEATGITHHLVPGDFAFFHVGSKVKFSTQSQGFAFYAVTRPVRAPHPNLKGREEDTKSRLPTLITMTTCIGYAYFLPKDEILNLEYLDVALEIFYGEGKVEWRMAGDSVMFTSETIDLVGLREMLGDLELTRTSPEFILKMLDFITEGRAPEAN
ncbi:ethanolamine utilization [Fusarium mundagurra]|uniref:Ethanolamine utilization n=1 Tax=Fusarium mundagurra TaxID=1567541 RepID=A0A8H5YRR0_9HYPO|nr:ethanolamine utilization [Fusarium mundagurra]